MGTRLRSNWLAALLLAPLCAAPAHAASIYSFVDLGTLGGSTSFALDVNMHRQVTGNAQTPIGQPNPRLNAFLYSGSGPMQNLGVLPGSNNFSRGYAINASGVVVGESDNNSSRAFRSSGGAMSLLPGLSGGNGGAVAHDINDAGVIVGASSNGTASRPVVWTAGAPTDLGSLDGQTSTPGRAWGINNQGQMVGVSRRDAGGSIAQATLWNGIGAAPLNLRSLLADSFSEALAINESGVVVGAAVNGTTQFGTSIRRAVRWTPGSPGYQIEALGSLGLTFSEAKDVNASGQIVGSATNILGQAQRAFLWDSGVMVDLNTLATSPGWVLTSAEGINDLGDIVGFGTFGGSTRAFMLTTVVPVPGSALLMLSSLVVFATLGWKRRRR